MEGGEAGEGGEGREEEVGKRLCFIWNLFPSLFALQDLTFLCTMTKYPFLSTLE
jgi:hypothetical protein